jgi:hypothetical protein
MMRETALILRGMLKEKNSMLRADVVHNPFIPLILRGDGEDGSLKRGS